MTSAQRQRKERRAMARSRFALSLALAIGGCEGLIKSKAREAADHASISYQQQPPPDAHVHLHEVPALKPRPKNLCGGVVCKESEYCAATQDGTQFCLQQGLAAGRPFRQQESSLLPTLSEGAKTDWHTSPIQPQYPKSSAARQYIGECWAAIGQAEHASVASFSAHALELAVLGAPAELISGALNAAMDEIQHAKLALGLASFYLEKPTLSPGSIAGVRTSSFSGGTTYNLTALAVSTAKDGCVAETIASVEAMFALAKTTDLAVRGALTTIAADEARHAVLGWRALEWAVSKDPTLADTLVDTITRAIETLCESPTDATRRQQTAQRANAAVAVAHGVMSEQTRADARHFAVETVIKPALQLLKQREASHSASDFVKAHFEAAIA